MRRKGSDVQVMKLTQVEWKMTVPNALSLFRIVLLPVFVVLYLNSQDNSAMLYGAVGVLLLSGLSDALDGFIARRFGQISDLGKILDPVADKLTQVTVVLCLALRYHELIGLLVICLVKEACQALGGLLLLLRGQAIRGAHWYGKVSTFVFYGAMFLIVLWPGMPSWLFTTLIVLVAVCMLFAFYKYMRVFFQIRKTLPPPSRPTDPHD